MYEKLIAALRIGCQDADDCEDCAVYDNKIGDCDIWRKAADAIEKLETELNQIRSELGLAISEINKAKPCGLCANYTGSWGTFCADCDDSRESFHPQFEWRGYREDGGVSA